MQFFNSQNYDHVKLGESIELPTATGGLHFTGIVPLPTWTPLRFVYIAAAMAQYLAVVAILAIWFIVMTTSQRNMASPSIRWVQEDETDPSLFVSTRLFSMPVVVPLVVFSLISALTNSAQCVRSREPVDGTPNAWKWLDNFASAPFMMTTILLLCRTTDFRDAISVWMLTAFSAVLGVLMELRWPARRTETAYEKKPPGPYDKFVALGYFVAELVPYAIVWGLYLWPSFVRLHSPAWFVCAAVVTTFLLVCLFAALQLLHIMYPFYSMTHELVFTALGVVSKQALVWITLYGFVHSS